MHFEFLVEDPSGSILLELVLPKIFEKMEEVTYRVHAFRGVGRIPPNLRPTTQPSKRILLDQLPRLLAGYLSTPGIDVVVVVLDLDNRPAREFTGELDQLARSVDADALAIFCLAIEEMEAWLLGDQQAILDAFPDAKQRILRDYEQDSICGTWEVLANAIHKGGAKSLSGLPYHAIGKLKCEWASKIAPQMRLEANASPSFRNFRDQILRRLN